MLFSALTLLASTLSQPAAAAEETDRDDGRRHVFSIEPVKLTSLMLNLHPDWAAWGIESGVRVSDHLWLQVFLEVDKGTQINGYYVEGKDFLLNHGYLGIVNTGRWYFRPDRSSGFLDAGVALQAGRQQYLDAARNAQQRNGFTVTPVVLGGYEAMFGGNLFFKLRGGGGYNAYRGGTIDGHLNLENRESQARTYYSPHTHLTEVFFQPFMYIGDISLGAKFGKKGSKRATR